jgi:membrane protein YdbS with pleckstrin-like domain
MQCGVCGSRVEAGSRFCNHCGTTVDAVAVAVEPNAAPARRQPEQPEHVIFTVRPSFLFVGVKYGVAAALWLLASALIAWIVSYFDRDPVAGAAAVAIVGLLLFAGPAFSHLRRQRYAYTLTNYKLEIQEGILATTTRNIRLSKIQDVTVQWSLLKRMVGVGNIVIDTAAEAGRLYIANIPNPKRYADILLRELQRWN